MPPSSPMPPWKRFIVARVIPWMVVLFGSAFVLLGVENTSRAAASAGWPTVEGTVVRTSIEIKTSMTTGHSARTTTWRPVVVYEYVVDERRYEADRVAFGAYATADRADAEQVVGRYAAGTEILVRYDPGDPGLAVIEPGAAGAPWIFTAIGALFVLAGLGFVVLFPKLVARGIG